MNNTAGIVVQLVLLLVVVVLFVFWVSMLITAIQAEEGANKIAWGVGDSAGQSCRCVHLSCVSIFLGATPEKAAVSLAADWAAE